MYPLFLSSAEVIILVTIFAICGSFSEERLLWQLLCAKILLVADFKRLILFVADFERSDTFLTTFFSLNLIFGRNCGHLGVLGIQ